MEATDDARFDEAIATFEETLKIKGDSPDALLELGRYRLARAVRAGQNDRMLPLPMFLPYPPILSIQ